jgi:histidyl-tRNA synthetase
LSLRYDLTAPLARYVAENWERLPKPYRSYRAGWVFRNEKPGPGRFRQFMQFDADTVGAAGPEADAEMCMMAADTLEALGFKKGEYVIKVNSRKVLDGYMAKAGLAGAHNEKRRLAVLRAIDKFDRLSEGGVRALLGEGRRDDSGDWTPGAQLSNEQIDIFFSTMLKSSITHYEPADQAGYGTGFVEFEDKRWVANYFALNALADELSTSDIGSDGVSELKAMASLFESARYRDRIDIDPSVVRGLEYYTGPVFEAQLLERIPNEKGQPVVFRFGRRRRAL